MTVDTRTDLDFLTELMRAKQTVVSAERDVDSAKSALKDAKTDLHKLLDGLEPHVAARRDQLQLPKFPGFEKPRDDDDDDPKQKRTD